MTATTGDAYDRALEVEAYMSGQEITSSQIDLLNVIRRVVDNEEITSLPWSHNGVCVHCGFTVKDSGDGYHFLHVIGPGANSKYCDPDSPESGALRSEKDRRPADDLESPDEVVRRAFDHYVADGKGVDYDTQVGQLLWDTVYDAVSNAMRSDGFIQDPYA